MLRRSAVLLALLLAGASPAGAAALPAPAVTGYVSVGEAGTRGAIGKTAATVTDFGIDGATVADGGAGIVLGDDVRAALAEAHAAGRPASLLLSNFDGDLGDFSPQRGADLLRDPDHRATTIAALAAEVVGTGWDGVTVDLESLELPDRAPLVAFVTELRAAMPEGTTVDVDVPAGEAPDAPYVAPFDLPGLAAAADHLTLMAYDQHYAGGAPGPIAGLPWFGRVLREALAQVPAAKVRVGVAGYGYRWRKGHATDALTVRRARALAGSRAHWNARQGEWSATLPGGRGTLWWSDRRSVAARIRLAGAAGTGGVALWRVGSADPLG